MITLHGDDFQTSTAVLKFDETYGEKNNRFNIIYNRIYIFTFVAEDIAHVCIQFIAMMWTPESMYFTVLIVHRIVLVGPGSFLPRWRTEKTGER